MQEDFLLPPPPPPHNLPAPPPLNPRRPINLLERPKYVGEQKTRLASQADCYGYTYGSLAEKDTNFTPQTNWRLTPEATVALEDGQGVECTVKTFTGSFKVVLDVDHITERSFVVQQIQRQARAGKRKEMILAQGLSKDDWAVFAQKMMKTFLEEMRTNYREKVPIEAIGMQASLLPARMIDLKPGDIEYFFNSRDGILDSMGNPKPDSKAALDPARMKSCREIRYNPTGLAGFAVFLDEPLARGHGREYFEGLVISVFSALFGWASPFNRHFFRKMATIIVEGPPCTGKTFRAQLALVLGSTIAHFYSGSSSVPGMQEALSKLGLLGVIDDLESRPKEEKIGLLDFEQTTTQTVSGGGRARVAPVMITMNKEDVARKKKYLEGRCVIIPCLTASYKEPKEGLQKVVDLIVVNSTIQSSDKPWDFLCKKFHELFFKTDLIPPEMQKGLKDYHLISGSQTHCMRYLLLLAETCNEIQALCPKKGWREVLSHGLLFMWPKAIDEWMAEMPNSKWFLEGGSKAFVSKYLTSYYAGEEGPDSQAASLEVVQMENSFTMDFLIPVLETLRQRLQGPIPLGDTCSDLWIIGKKGSDQVSIFFRQPGGYKLRYNAKFELKHYRQLFSQWGANFNATATTRDNSKRGWTIDMKKLPKDLLIPFCEQLYRLDIDAPIRAAFRFGEELNSKETSVLNQQQDELDNPWADTSPEADSLGAVSDEDLDASANFYRPVHTSTQKPADQAFCESPLVQEQVTETLSGVSLVEEEEEEDGDENDLDETFVRPKRPAPKSVRKGGGGGAKRKKSK